MDEIHALEPALLELEKQQRPDTSECEDVTDPGVVVPAELKIAALLAIKPIENHAASDHRSNKRFYIFIPAAFFRFLMFLFSQHFLNVH